MSRIGNKPITIPAGVEVTLDGNVITVKGPKGTMTKELHKNMEVSINGTEITVNDGNTFIQIQPKGKKLTIQ